LIKAPLLSLLFLDHQVLPYFQGNNYSWADKLQPRPSRGGQAKTHPRYFFFAREAWKIFFFKV